MVEVVLPGEAIHSLAAMVVSRIDSRMMRNEGSCTHFGVRQRRSHDNHRVARREPCLDHRCVVVDAALLHVDLDPPRVYVLEPRAPRARGSQKRHLRATRQGNRAGKITG